MTEVALAKKLRAIANTGRREGEGYFYHYTLGSNYRITGLQAAVLLAQLERLPAQNARRAQYARILREQTADLLPGSSPWQHVPPDEAAQVHTNYLMLGRIDAAKFGATRNEFHRHLTAAGIPCTPFYPHPLYLAIRSIVQAVAVWSRVPWLKPVSWMRSGFRTACCWSRMTKPRRNSRWDTLRGPQPAAVPPISSRLVFSECCR